MSKFIEESAQCRTISDLIILSKKYREENLIPEFKNNLLTGLIKLPQDNFRTFSNGPYNHRVVDFGYVSLPSALEHPIYWFDKEDKCVYLGEAEYILDKSIKKPLTKVNTDEYYYYGDRTFYEKSQAMLVIKWKKVNRPTKNGFLLQSIEAIVNWINDEWYKKWVIDFINTHQFRQLDYSITFIVTHPEIELLSKMTIEGITGLPLLKIVTGEMEESEDYRYHRCWGCTDTDRVTYNRNFHEGKNLKEICALPLNVIRSLWAYQNVNVWDTVRKMMTLRGCTPDEAIRCLDRNFRNDQLSKIDEILRQKYNNKNIFTYTTLFNYLDRLDVNEAIQLDEALMLIVDTLSMHRQVNEEPKFMEKDSLKREHDLIMRKQREVRDELTAQRIKERYDDKYYFEDSDFLIRQIRSYEDLMDEGRQQDNCLRYCYASRIAAGTSVIYVMRSKKDPDKSLISVEIDPTGAFRRQQYLSHDRDIKDQKQLNFLEKWDKYREKINNKEITGVVGSLDFA